MNNKKKLKHILCLFAGCLFLNFSMFAQDATLPEGKEISHVVYITANTGEDTSYISQQIFQQINEASTQDKDATLLLVGNLIQKQGYPKNDKDRAKEQDFLRKRLLEPLKNFNGNLVFTPGQNEWNTKDPQDNLDDLESFLQDNSKAEFWPNDGCPLEHESLSENVELVLVDSQWFLEDWDKYPYMNNKCDIKNRKQFFIEFRDELKDNYGKTIIVAVRNPVLSNTKFGLINSVGGFSRQDFENVMHRNFREQLETQAGLFDDVIFVSGSDHNLQYLDHHEVPQIISGSASKKTQKASIKKKGQFASSKHGYAKLFVFKDNSSMVNFYEATATGQKLLFSKKIARQRPRLNEVSYKPKESYGKTNKASIYSKEEVAKGGLYTWFFGKHYRQVYGRDIEVPNLFIDDLPGNLKPISEGGGHQSRSIRLVNDEKHEYTLREMRKSAERLIQNQVKTHTVGPYINNTVAERIVQDFYTTAQPYAPFAVGDLSEPLNIYHSDPKLYYVPKQKGLGVFNDDYGDKLYMYEAHVGDENKDFETFGSPEDILSTSDLLEEMREGKKAYVDEAAYIKARIFDMMIGDWDRHEDQWRWAEYEQPDGRKKYEPIPRDRDQAFSKYDGFILKALKLAVPMFRAMETYDDEINSVKWFNVAAYPLDNKFIQKSNWEDWQKQIDFIQAHLTDEKIEKAFATLPEDTKGESIEKIKKTLKYRRDHLASMVKPYYKYLNKFDVITGTEEDDLFNIIRKPNGITTIEIESDGKTVFQNSYDHKQVKNIWIYGLDGDDEFKISGKGDHLINLKVLGGEEHDTYTFSNTKKAKLYDYKSKKISIKNPKSHKWLVNSYDINNYRHDKYRYDQNTILPSIGFNRDAGFKVGVKDTYTTYGLARNPFTTQHTFELNYYFNTQGFDFNYYGEFAHIFYNWNLGIEARYTSPNYTINYFGKGNETTYDRSEVSRNFNRVPIQQWKFAPSLIWNNDYGSSFRIKPIIESLDVDNDGNDFIYQSFPKTYPIFESQLYAGGEIGYDFINKDGKIAFPRRGMEFHITSGYKTNIDDHDNEFGYVKPNFSIDIPLHSSGLAVLATKLGGEFIIGDNYEFYHAATLGGNESIRAFRPQRFNGRTAVYQSTDLRVGITKFRTNFIPIRMGVSLGFDYGRVWADDQSSEKWHNGYGGSLFINGFNFITGNVGLYHSKEDGNRVTFIVGFKF